MYVNALLNYMVKDRRIHSEARPWPHTYTPIYPATLYLVLRPFVDDDPLPFLHLTIYYYQKVMEVIDHA